MNQAERNLKAASIALSAASLGIFAHGVVALGFLIKLNLFMYSLLLAYIAKVGWQIAEHVRKEEESKPILSAAVEIPQGFDDTQVIRDFVGYWLSQEKHLLVIGGTGDGKSTLIKGIISELQDWDISVLDIDYAKGDYPERVEIYCDYDTIASKMRQESLELERRVKLRQEQGAAVAQTFSYQLTVGEELPALVQKIGETQKVWSSEMAKRGRKVRMFIALCAQNFTAKNVGFAGDMESTKSCFIRVDLGKFAKQRAVTLKNVELLSWLTEVPKGRFLVDDQPCEWIINLSKPEATSQDKTIRSLASDGKTPAQIVFALWGEKPSKHKVYTDKLAAVMEALKS